MRRYKVLLDNVIVVAAYLAIIFAPIPEVSLVVEGLVEFQEPCVGPIKVLLLNAGFSTRGFENVTAGLENVTGLLPSSQESG